MTRPWTQQRHVLITGASSGIGAALARALARTAGRLTLVSRDRGGRLTELARELSGDSPCAIEAVTLDVNDRAGAATLIARLTAEGPVHGFVHCAGGAHCFGPFAGMGPEDIDRILDTNLRSTLHWLHLLVPRMRHNELPAGEEKRGHVVVTSSRSAERALPRLAVYAAAKAGVDQAIAALRTEHARDRIVFTGVNPGSIDTDFTAEWDHAIRDAHNDESMTVEQAIRPILMALEARFAINRVSYQSLRQWQGEPGVL
jgi:NAD(P)-dependent dehydrogenase (short-subunit alcohol dehydrogenase family)